MNISDLTELSPSELRVVSKKNLSFFAVLTALDLSVFYYSLFTDNWTMMFLSLGLFIACLALYDNHKVAQDLYDASELAERP